MTQNLVVHALGMVSSLILPLFNIPLIVRMIQRRSSADLSLVWAIGVWICIVGMGPAAWTSPDNIFKIFSVINLSFFSAVVFCAIYFRVKKKN